MALQIRLFFFLIAAVLTGAAPASAEEKSAPQVAVERAWIRASTIPVTAGYMVLTNKGTRPVRLTGVRSPFAARMEIHSMEMKDGVARMRRVDVLTVSPGQSRALRPGGYHLMIMGLKQVPLVERTQVPVVLRFSDGSELRLTLSVRKRAPAAH